MIASEDIGFQQNDIKSGFIRQMPLRCDFNLQLKSYNFYCDVDLFTKKFLSQRNHMRLGNHAIVNVSIFL